MYLVINLMRQSAMPTNDTSLHSLILFTYICVAYLKTLSMENSEYTLSNQRMS